MGRERETKYQEKQRLKVRLADKRDRLHTKERDADMRRTTALHRQKGRKRHKRHADKNRLRRSISPGLQYTNG